MNFAFRTWRPSGADVDDSLLALEEEARVAVGLFLLRAVPFRVPHRSAEFSHRFIRPFLLLFLLFCLHLAWLGLNYFFYLPQYFFLFFVD